MSMKAKRDTAGLDEGGLQSRPFGVVP